MVWITNLDYITNFKEMTVCNLFIFPLGLVASGHFVFFITKPVIYFYLRSYFNEIWQHVETTIKKLHEMDKKCIYKNLLLSSFTK